MRSDAEFRQRYLDFLDDLLSHGYPQSGTDDQASPAPTKRIPRQERPPIPTNEDYRTDFYTDHHLLAHEVQTHRHTFTCFKGGRTSCRFQYPHDIVQDSSLDLETNSVHLRVQHPLINWHNPHLLVATRHNHDLKSVQSGQSGSAAASYITSYSTKSEETPANQISMINAVYERMATMGSAKTEAQSFLTRCVMQFGRERQVHAQQAATYVRDLGDTEQSHPTVAMMSGQLVATVIALYGSLRDLNGASPDVGSTGPPGAPDDDPPAVSEPEDLTAVQPGRDTVDEPSCSNLHADDDEEDDGFDEGGMLPLNTKGLAHQVDDYLYRGETLASLTFYQFVQYVKLDPPPKKRNKNHHDLRASHPNFPKYIRRYTPNRTHGIPRCIISRFPRSDGSEGHGDEYCAAMMAHFIPFSDSVALKTRTETWEAAFQRTTFSPRAKKTMANWAALNECEDARDADQLMRRRREANHSAKIDQQVRAAGTEPVDDSMADINVEALLYSRAEQSAETLKFVSVLDSNGWFQTAGFSQESISTAVAPVFTSAVNRRLWKKEQDLLEAKARADLTVPTASSGVLAEQLAFDTPVSAAPATDDVLDLVNGLPAHPTQRLHWRDLPPHALLDELVRERNLTPSQRLAFCIAGRRFFDVMHGEHTTFHAVARL
ncbi:unnamed protein product [Tilletia controversa]|nr:unnamed protein product [Tilletia controversa]